MSKGKAFMKRPKYCRNRVILVSLMAGTVTTLSGHGCNFTENCNFYRKGGYPKTLTGS